MDCDYYEPVYKDIIYKQTDPHGDVIETRSPALYAEFCRARMDYIIKGRDCEDCTVCRSSKVSAPYELPLAG